MKLPNWPPRDWRAVLALTATIAGAAVITVLESWLISIIAYGAWSAARENARLEAIASALKHLIWGELIIFLSLGLAITPRKMKLDRGGAELSGGDEDPRP